MANKQDTEDELDDELDGDSEPTPEEIAQAETALSRLVAALANLDDESLRLGLASMREQTRLEVAQQLGLSRATMHLGDALVPLFRRKVLTAPPTRQLGAAFSIVEAANDDTVEALGDAHEDPTIEELQAVLPAVIEEHGQPTVSLLVAAYAASDARCQAVMAELLDTDERFVLPDPPDIDEIAPPPSGLELHRRTAEEDAAQAEKREARKAAKEAKRAADQARREAIAAGQAARRAAQHEAKKKSRH